MNISIIKKTFIGVFLVFSLLCLQYSCISRADTTEERIIRFCERGLQEKGFETDTFEGLVAAFETDASKRWLSLPVLASKFPEQSVPFLKKALTDELLSNRIRSAHLLGTLGDKSGLEQMRKDYNELVPRGGAPKPDDPNISNDPVKLEKWQRNRIYRISEGLEVGLVMAELGDFNGYDLAACQVKDGELAAIRYRATDVLAEIAKLDEEILKSKNMDPVAVLAEAVELEKERTAYIRIVMAAEKLRDIKGQLIIEAAGKNEHQSSMDLRRVNNSIMKIQREVREKYNIADPNVVPQ